MKNIVFPVITTDRPFGDNWHISRRTVLRSVIGGNGSLLFAASGNWAGAAEPAGDMGKRWLQFHYTAAPRGFEEILAELKQLPLRLSEVYGSPAIVRAVNVLIFSDRGQYLTHLKKTLPNAPRRTSLFIVRSGRPTILVVQGETLQQDLMHEAVHSLNHLTFRNTSMPLWMDEGLAEWAEDSLEQQSRVHGKSLRQLLGGQRMLLPEPISLAALEKIKSTTRADAVDYAASWAWCRFLLTEKYRCRGVWNRYLQDIQGGQQAGRLSHRLALTVPDYEQRFLRFLTSI
jgi:hypothetical protein